ncbi:Phytoene synthase [Actinidia chinensis var. chinensis]|uniref:15-cis-phytoene synthase n=1 Tax=Actinidia chinensis var. chinensis TaxID=1590841 RepID=A0A2R6R4P4_ACTCC|nr:Phytoene synthase [Actinidia chinensis var. chinensis]
MLSILMGCGWGGGCIAWGRRLDELVDGVNGSHANHDTLDRWKQRTVDTYEGRPWDIYDVALFDTVSNFPIDIQLFHDLTEGTRLDMMNKRFANFDELYLYENYVNGTIFLLFFQMMGIDPESKSSLESVYHATSIFAAGFGLIDMLRDVGEDARLGRIFLPKDELLLAGISDDDIFNGKVTDNWRAFMKGQIKRARGLLDEGKHVINELEVDVRWAIWTGLLLYMQLLDGIEANDYDNLTKKISLGKGKMLLTTLVGYGKSHGLF